MKYDLTQHARDVLREREIHKEWLEQVLQNPEWTEPDSTDRDLEHRLGRIEKYGNRILRVVVNPRVDPMRVITVYFDRSVKGKQ